MQSCNKKVLDFIRQSELYDKILKYEAVNLADLLKLLRGHGIKCSKKFLAAFLDDKVRSFFLLLLCSPTPLSLQGVSYNKT